MTVTFTTVITDEAVSYARAATKTPGWYLTPKKWALSSYDGELSTERTYSSMNSPWLTQTFSAVYNRENNKLGHSIVIPPNPTDITSDKDIKEVYFIYQDHFGNEFLFAIAHPDSDLVFSPGLGQGYLFEFTLSNISVEESFVINYTYPQDIEDHNTSLTAHAELFENISGLKVSYDSAQQMLVFTDERN